MMMTIYQSSYINNRIAHFIHQPSRKKHKHQKTNESYKHGLSLAKFLFKGSRRFVSKSEVVHRTVPYSSAIRLFYYSCADV